MLIGAKRHLDTDGCTIGWEKKYRRRYYAFSIPVIVFSTLTGTANFGMDSYVSEENKSTATAIVGGFNIACGILGTLQNFLRLAENMENHRVSGVAWSKLQRSIQIELSLDCCRRSPCCDFLNICRAEYDRLIEQSPLISDEIIQLFKRRFKDYDIAVPSICNGLDKITIFKDVVRKNVNKKLKKKLKKILFHNFFIVLVINDKNICN